ncbi:MAG TPA: hypothetical protein VLH75_17845 [Longimicrobiales bacterium]|nr:hypothetical protein [Longimicrobiales bacterium]
MPSDRKKVASSDLALKALEALGPRVEAFHSAVATAEEEIRSYVTHRRGNAEHRSEQTLAELGPFAAGRIDPAKFAALLVDVDDLTPEAEGVMERAEHILAEFAVGTDFHLVSVPKGGDLRDAVKEALNHVGQVFGASRAVELARSGVFDPAQHNVFLSGLPFRKWHREERRLAPPLVVELEADDLLPAGLGEFLDGAVKVVLVVKGPTTPAPLARLITPGTYVVQTADPAELGGLARSPHPGVALLFDATRAEQARFVHDPDAGSAPWKRLMVSHMPEQPEVGRGRRTPTWLEELAHLEALARKPAGAADVTAASESADETSPADQLAAYLLSRVDLGGV